MYKILISIGCFLVSYAILCQNKEAEDIFTKYDQYIVDSHDPNAPWPKIYAESKQKELAALGSFKESLTSIDYQKLTETNKINYDMLNFILDDKIFNIEYGSYHIPITSEGGFVTGIMYRIQNFRITNDKKLEEYFNLLETLPAYISNQIENLKTGTSKNLKSSKFIANKFLEILKNLLKSFDHESDFEKVINSSRIEVSTEKSQKLNHLIQQKIRPSYQKLYDYIKTEYLPQAFEHIGAKHLPKGKEYYEQRVRYFTTLDLSPSEIFQKGEEEVKRIKEEMEAIINELEFQGSLQDFIHFLRTDPQFYAKSPEEILMRASFICKEVENEIPKYFDNMPRMPFGVKPVPLAIAPNYTAGRYSRGSYKDHRAGKYWVNTTKLESRPLYSLPALSLHEAVPGHHLQIMLAQELENLPNFRKAYISAFGEGWGLYAEYLGKEMGVYKTLYEDFGRLTYEMWRACRLVVDVGMHYYGWDRQRAVDFMANNTALSLHEVNTEIDRYIGWPAQAVSYKIGELKIRELRKNAERSLSSDFDIREFHNVILKNGSITLNTLEKNVNSYINEKLNKLNHKKQ